MNDELNPAPLANGSAEGLGPVPVLSTEPLKASDMLSMKVGAKKRRKRKAKPAAPKVPRAPKAKPIDRLLAEHLSSVNGDAAAVEEAPTSPRVDVGADHFVEARERRHESHFRADAQGRVTLPPKSTFWDRFVFGFRHMTGLDGDTTPMRPSTQFAILLCIASGVAVVGVSYPFW